MSERHDGSELARELCVAAEYIEATGGHCSEELLRDAAARIEQLERERDGLRADAERYLCWREWALSADPIGGLADALYDAETPEQCDAALDAAIDASRRETKA